jgi:ABC-type amino acid transport substrate-binding protein
MTFTIAGAPKVNRLSDLRGRRVAVMSGSNSLTFLKQRNEPDVTLVPLTTVKPFFESLRTGECDVAITIETRVSG